MADPNDRLLVDEKVQSCSADYSPLVAANMDVVEDVEEYFDDEEDDQDLQDDSMQEASARQEKSLGTLTKRFIKFLQDSPQSLVDINTVRLTWNLLVV